MNLLDRVDKAIDEMGLNKTICEVLETKVTYTVQEVQLKLSDENLGDRIAWLMIHRSGDDKLTFHVDGALTKEQWADVVKHIQSVK